LISVAQRYDEAYFSEAVLQFDEEVKILGGAALQCA
jgi:hypothetical protein